MTSELGWAKMEPILDQVMPVPQRSRRFILFWWTAAAVIAVVLIGYGTWMKRDAYTQQIAIEETPSMKVPVVPQTDDAALLPSMSNNTGQQEVAAIQEQQVPEVKTETEHQLTPSTSRPTAIGATKKSNSNRISGSTLSAEKQTSSESTVAIQMSDLNESEIITSHIPESTTPDGIAISESVPTPAVSEMSALDFLPLTDVSWDSATEITMDIAHSEIQKSVMTTKRMFSPYLTVSGLAGFEKGYGGHGGAGLDFAITPSLSLKSDLGYAIYKPHGEVFSAERDAAENNIVVQEDLGYLGIGQYISADALKATSNATATIAPLVETLTQFQCGLGLKLDVSKKFFIEGGAIVGFGSKGESRYPIVSYDPYNLPINGTAYSIENSFDSYDVIRSTTAALYGSVGLRPTRKSEVFVQYRHALNSYLTTAPTFSSVDGDRTDYIRGMNVGVRYHL